MAVAVVAVPLFFVVRIGAVMRIFGIVVRLGAVMRFAVVAVLDFDPARLVAESLTFDPVAWRTGKITNGRAW